MKRNYLILLVSLLCSFVSAKETVYLKNLRCEYLTNPVGIDHVAPLLSWEAVSSHRGEEQIAYRIIVSDNSSDCQNFKGNVWNSGKVTSSQMNNIAYGGKRLRSSTRYYWRICMFTTRGQVWSKPAFFETAFLSPADWKGIWIGDGSKAPERKEDFYKEDPAPILGKEYNIEKEIVSARLYVAGLGYYEATVNNQKVDDSFLNPGWTNFDKTVQYRTFVVDSLCRQGNNKIEILLGNGFYNPLPMPIFRPMREYLPIGRPKVKAQLVITYTDGKKEVIATDTSWQVTYSPIVKNNTYLGESYDARLESDAIRSRSKSAVAADAPKGVLRAQMQPPIRETARLKPIRMTESRPGVYVFDMGQNFAGIVRMKVKGPEGTKVTLRYGEDVYSDGSLNGMTSVAGQNKKVWGADRSVEGQPQTAWQEDSYILRGGDVEVWQPKFTFHGFRYVEITGYPGRPALDCLEGIRLSAALNKTGEFSCSNEMLNRLEKVIEWTFLSNVFSVQSDCPHREKLGYGGDIAATSDAFCYMFDMSNFYSKTVRDFEEARRPTGAMTEVAPYMGIADCGFGEGSGPIGWQLAYGLVQKRLYDYYGNKRIIADNYEVFKQQISFLQSKAQNHIMGDYCLGDHEALEYNFKRISLETRCRELTATAHYYHHVQLLAEFAKLLDKPKDYAVYTQLAGDIKNAFIAKFYNRENGVLGNNTQISQTFGLSYNLIPEGEKNKALDQLVRNIHRVNDHVLTGMFSTPMILDVLSDNNYADLAYTLVSNRDFPGWGYMLENGATTVWETWAPSDNVYSKNHPMFGSVNEWFYKTLLGINATSAGFETVCIAPKPVQGLDWAKGTYHSIKGPIAVEWRKGKEHFTLVTTIPFGIKARIAIPNTAKGEVLESGKSLDKADGVTFVAVENGNTVVDVVSGHYNFTIRN